MRVYMLEADRVSAAKLAMVRERFPRRYARAMRYANPEDARTCIAAGVLLAAVLGIRDESLIRLTSEGKPYLDEGPAFSLSHSGNRCVLAVGAGRLGVDIERLAPDNLIAARAALTERELDWISAALLERFHLLWTMKESVYKAVGGYTDPRQISVLDGLPDGLFLSSRIFDGYALSVCSEEELVDIEPTVFL